VLLLNRVNSISFFLIFLVSFFIILEFINIVQVKAQEPIKGTTANVTVKGYLDKLIVTYFPVNFTVGFGVQPGSVYPKVNEQPFLEVTTGPSTNVEWNIAINGSDMVNELGNRIPVENITVNSTNRPVPFSLSNSLQDLEYLIGADESRQIYFYLYIPVGAANGTYKGNIWIYAWSNDASEDSNNNTWTGLDNTTVKVAVTYGVEWTLTPIDFGLLSPGVVGAKAKDNFGWPTNITVVDNTNVPVDLYINGTDLVNASEIPVIGSKNITYYNYTHNNYDLLPDLSSSAIHTLNKTRPISITYGDFANWRGIGNNTDVYSYWNISLAILGLKGAYYGNVTARIFVTGEFD
jgi:hypothetical protein